MVDSPRFLSFKTRKIGAKHEVKENENWGWPAAGELVQQVFDVTSNLHKIGVLVICIGPFRNDALFPANGKQPGSVSHLFKTSS